MQQAHPSSKKKVKSSISTPPPPLLEDEPTKPAIKSTIVVIPETKELEKVGCDHQTFLTINYRKLDLP